MPLLKHETSTRYQWPETSGGLIQAMEVVRQKNGRAVAYLQAKEDPSLKQPRLQLRAAIRAKGWGTLSDYRDGNYVLRVNGFANDNDLLSTLNANGAIDGTPQISTRAAEKEKPQGFIDSIRTNSLRASGIFYSMGNAVYLASGLLRSKEKGKVDYGQIGSALTWGAGDLLVTAIGGKDDGRQLTSLLTKLRQHYVREGIDIPITAAIHSETSDHGKSIGSKIYDFTHEYLNQIKCFTESVAAIGYYKAGKDQGNVWKQRTAVTFGLGFLASGLIPEKKIDPDKYEAAGTLGRLWMRVQSNPLSIGGLSGYSNTILTTYGAFDEGRRLNNPANYPHKIHKTTGATITPSKYYKLDYAAPAVMFFGNGLYAASKKTTGGDIRTEAIEQDVYSIASQILNKLPEEKRAAAVESTVGFLAERPEMRGTKQELRTKLHETMVKQSQNPWFEPLAVTLAKAQPSLAPQAPLPLVSHIQPQQKGVAPAAIAAEQHR